MAVYEVYSHPELRRYRTHVCSKASLLIILILGLTFIPPLFVVYRSYGFWRKTDTYLEYPDIHYKSEMLLVAELQNSGEYLTYSTFQNYNNIQQANLRVPLITTKAMAIEFFSKVEAKCFHVDERKSREEDVNRDGRPDYLLLNVELPLLDTENVLGIRAILIFDYRLYQFSTLTMESMAYITHDSPKPGASYNVIGELLFSQKEPLSHRGTDNRYNVSIIDSTSIYAEDYLFTNIFKNYVSRNISTYLQAPYSVWTSGRAAGQPFVLSANISYPEQEFTYRPGFWYLIKWGWVQYVSVLLLFLFVFDRIKVFIFQNQIVTTMVDKAWKNEKVH